MVENINHVRRTRVEPRCDMDGFSIGSCPQSSMTKAISQPDRFYRRLIDHLKVSIVIPKSDVFSLLNKIKRLTPYQILFVSSQLKAESSLSKCVKV